MAHFNPRIYLHCGRLEVLPQVFRTLFPPRRSFLIAFAVGGMISSNFRWTPFRLIVYFGNIRRRILKIVSYMGVWIYPPKNIQYTTHRNSIQMQHPKRGELAWGVCWGEERDLRVLYSWRIWLQTSFRPPWARIVRKPIIRLVAYLFFSPKEPLMLFLLRPKLFVVLANS